MPKNKTQTKPKKKNLKKSDSYIDEIKDLNKKIESLTKDLEKSEDKHLRLMAEFENFKKRKEKSVQDSYSRILENIIIMFLPILDDFERMLSSNDNDDKKFEEGISIIQSKFEKILNNYGVSSFNSKGEIFSPDLHEAVMAQHSNKKNNLIIEEFEKGYKISDKVIRHAKVIVSKGKK